MSARVLALARTLSLAALSLSTLAWGVGCGADSGNLSGAGGSAGTAGTGGTGLSGPTALEFDREEDQLFLAPGAALTLRVKVQPAGEYTVRFSLIGESGDGSLLVTEAETGGGSVAETRLLAPSSPAEFAVRASVGADVSATLSVTVAEQGVTGVQLTPLYAGRRQVTEWVASAHPSTPCSQLEGNPAPDGLFVTTGDPDEPYLVMEGLPAGTVAAITVRAGQFAGGCQDVELTPAAMVVVDIPIIDRPIQLSATHLNLSLGINAGDGWTSTVNAAIEEARLGLGGGASNDRAALLNAMQSELTPTDATAFAVARIAGTWDELLANLLPDTLLSDQLRDWAVEQGPNLLGPEVLKGQLNQAGSVDGFGIWTLESIAGLQPEQLSLPRDVLVDWTAQPDDTLEFGAQLFWLPSRFATALAERSAFEQTGAESASEALADLVNCDALASALTLQSAVDIYAGCGQTCVVALCESGLEVVWRRARDASPLSSTTILSITAAGDASVDQLARPVGLDGSWIGSLSVAGGEDLSSIDGAVHAEPAEPLPDP